MLNYGKTVQLFPRPVLKESMHKYKLRKFVHILKAIMSISKKKLWDEEIFMQLLLRNKVD